MDKKLLQKKEAWTKLWYKNQGLNLSLDLENCSTTLGYLQAFTVHLSTITVS